MSDTAPGEVLGSGFDGTAYLMSDEQSRWVRKIYNVWPPPHGTHLKIVDPYIAELEAYRRIAQCPDLHGWVPSYIAHGERSLDIDYIEGEIFDHIKMEFTIEELRTIWGVLKMIIEMLHEVGVAHGDCQPHNILVDRSSSPPEPYLIDFSRATFQEYSSDWERDVRKDTDYVDDAFKELFQYKHSEIVKSILREKQLGVEYSVRELAEHLNSSHPWLDLPKDLSMDVVLEPLCILAKAQNLFEWRRREVTSRFLKLHLPRLKKQPLDAYDAINRRSMIMLQAYEALTSGDRECLHYLPSAIKLCQKELGFYDPFTLKLRLDLTLRSWRTGYAHLLFAALLRDLTDHGVEPVPESERHVVTDWWTQEYLIDEIRKRIDIAGRCHEMSSEDLAWNFDDHECNDDCSHHTDFAARTIVSGLASPMTSSDEQADSPAPALSSDAGAGETDAHSRTSLETTCIEDQIDVSVLRLEDKVPSLDTERTTTISTRERDD